MEVRSRSGVQDELIGATHEKPAIDGIIIISSFQERQMSAGHALTRVLH